MNGLLAIAFALPAWLSAVPESIADAGVEAALEALLEERAASGDVEESADEAIADDGEAEALAAGEADGGSPTSWGRYTGDLSDEELERRFVEDLPSLGSVSVGLAEAGRLINGIQLKPGDAWTVSTPAQAWGTQETIDFLMAAARAVKARLPTAPLLRVGHIGNPEGGYLRPHKSHQSGRDVDLGFYYPDGASRPRRHIGRIPEIDLAANWELVKALIVLTDVQVILVDRQIQKQLYQYALDQGEDRAWLDSVFRSGADSLVKHARRHRDHFHVRFYAARPQELGRRIQPLLAKRPEQNFAIHRVRSGDTLGHIARRYNSTVQLIKRANRMTTTSLRVGRTLSVPLRGPCTQCPLAPWVEVPPRRLPPSVAALEGQEPLTSAAVPSAVQRFAR